MSPRAAWRLERLGFDVFDYVLGKLDWLAAGLPTERSEPAPPRVAAAMDTDVPTCAPGDLVGDVAARVDGDCLVVNDARVVLGRLSIDATTPRSATAEDTMHPGPTTVRAGANLHETRARMTRRRVSSLVVTTPDGVLLGVLHVDGVDTEVGAPAAGS